MTAELEPRQSGGEGRRSPGGEDRGGGTQVAEIESGYPLVMTARPEQEHVNS
jgi:hypothetical protein